MHFIQRMDGTLHRFQVNKICLLGILKYESLRFYFAEPIFRQLIKYFLINFAQFCFIKTRVKGN